MWAAQHIFQFFESLDGESLRDKFVEAPRKFIITELSSSDLWKHRVDLLLQNFSILFLTTLLVDDFFFSTMTRQEQHFCIGEDNDIDNDVDSCIVQ